MEPLTYFPLVVELSPSVSVSVSSPRRLREAGLADLLKRRMVARPPSSWDGKWTFLDEDANMGVLGAELERWCWGCKSGNMMLGTRDCGGKGICGEELEDFKLDLSGFRTDGVEAVLVIGGEERGKGTALKEVWLSLSRKGGRIRSWSS